LIVARYRRPEEGRAAERSAMSFVGPVAALSFLVVLLLIARERKYLLTSTALMVIAGALAAWFGAIYFVYG
jgi:hypothetical protein